MGWEGESVREVYAVRPLHLPLHLRLCSDCLAYHTLHLCPLHLPPPLQCQVHTLRQAMDRTYDDFYASLPLLLPCPCPCLCGLAHWCCLSPSLSTLHPTLPCQVHTLRQAMDRTYDEFYASLPLLLPLACPCTCDLAHHVLQLCPFDPSPTLGAHTEASHGQNIRRLLRLAAWPLHLPLRPCSFLLPVSTLPLNARCTH